MNEVNQLEFYRSAVRALGYSDHTTQSVAEAIELAYRRGLSAGYDQGYNDGINGNQPELRELGEIPF